MPSRRGMTFYGKNKKAGVKLEYSTMVSNFTLKRHAIWTLAAT
jgi:hypothetical protein